MRSMVSNPLGERLGEGDYSRTVILWISSQMASATPSVSFSTSRLE
jgi:hypothetical protein